MNNIYSDNSVTNLAVRLNCVNYLIDYQRQLQLQKMLYCKMYFHCLFEIQEQQSYPYSKLLCFNFFEQNYEKYLSYYLILSLNHVTMGFLVEIKTLKIIRFIVYKKTDYDYIYSVTEDAKLQNQFKKLLRNPFKKYEFA